MLSARTRPLRVLAIAVGSLLMATPARGDAIDEHLAAIARVGPGGTGSAEARKAREALASQGVDLLPRLIVAMDTPNVVAANWYRTLFEDIVERELARPTAGFPLPVLKEYVLDSKRQGKARRRVLQLVEQLEPGYTAAVLPQFLGDREFRNDAIEAHLQAGDLARKAGDQAQAQRLYREAFDHARDANQIRTAAARLKSVGEQVSIVDHMGFLIDWYLIGPFDAPEYSGFETVFPPEQNVKQVDLTARYSGQQGRELSWQRHRTPDSMGQLNLIQAIASTREAVGYAYTEFHSPRDQHVQLRCGADDNCTVWLNGERIFGRNQWLNGTRLDRFTAPAHLRKGKNTLLVKICQGPQHKDPEVSNNWSLQLRFCDADGAAVGLTSALPPLESGKETAAQ